MNKLTSSNGPISRRRGVSTSYGTRNQKHFATNISEAPTQRIEGKNVDPSSLRGSKNNFEMTSGRTLFMSNPDSNSNLNNEFTDRNI